MRDGIKLIGDRLVASACVECGRPQPDLTRERCCRPECLGMAPLIHARNTEHGRRCLLTMLDRIRRDPAYRRAQKWRWLARCTRTSGEQIARQNRGLAKLTPGQITPVVIKERKPYEPGRPTN